MLFRSPPKLGEHRVQLVATRPGYPRDKLDAVLAQLRRPERIEFFDMEPVPISSSDIRERVARGEPIDDLVPAAVAAEIERLGLYRRDPGYSKPA